MSTAALWVDGWLLHPLHYLHPSIAQWLCSRICYPLERRRREEAKGARGE